MTVRTLNYTRRRRLRRDDVDVTISTSQYGEHVFDVSLALERYKLPPEARLFVEAYRQTHWMRFGFGTVGNVVSPKHRALAQFDNIDGVLFRVRVTEPAEPHGLLLAEGDRIPFRGKDEKVKKRIPLLPVVPEELRDEICKISYEANGPELVVNSALGNWRGVARDPVVIALVYPLVLRDILYRISFVEEDFDRDDRSDWRSRWCRFAELLPGGDLFPTERNDREDWIEKAVAAFSRRNASIAKFSAYWKEGNAT